MALFSLCLHMVHPLSPLWVVCLNFLFLKGYQSDWIRARATKDLSLTYLFKDIIFKSSHIPMYWVVGLKHGFGRGTQISRSLFHSFLGFHFYLFIYLFNFIFIDTITDVPIPLPALPSSTQPLSPSSSGHHHTIVCVYGLCMYVLWLIPSPFIQFPLPSDSCQSVPCVHASVSILSVYFVY